MNGRTGVARRPGNRRGRGWPGVVPLLGVTAAAGLVLAGCGSSGGAAGSSGLPDVAAPLLGGVSDEQFCATALQLAAEGQQHMEQQRQAAVHGGNVDGVAETRRVADTWAKLASIAPSELQPDLQSLADKTRSIADGNRDPQIGHSMVPAASHYGNWVRQHCPGIPTAVPHPGGASAVSHPGG